MSGDVQTTIIHDVSQMRTNCCSSSGAPDTFLAYICDCFNCSSSSSSSSSGGGDPCVDCDETQPSVVVTANGAPADSEGACHCSLIGFTYTYTSFDSGDCHWLWTGGNSPSDTTCGEGGMFTYYLHVAYQAGSGTYDVWVDTSNASATSAPAGALYSAKATSDLACVDGVLEGTVTLTPDLCNAVNHFTSLTAVFG